MPNEDRLSDTSSSLSKEDAEQAAKTLSGMLNDLQEAVIDGNGKRKKKVKDRTKQKGKAGGGRGAASSCSSRGKASSAARSSFTSGPDGFASRGKIFRERNSDQAGSQRSLQTVRERVTDPERRLSEALQIRQAVRSEHEEVSPVLWAWSRGAAPQKPGPSAAEVNLTGSSVSCGPDGCASSLNTDVSDVLGKSGATSSLHKHQLEHDVFDIVASTAGPTNAPDIMRKLNWPWIRDSCLVNSRLKPN